MHLKIHTAKNQLITASGVIHNSAFPVIPAVCLRPQQPQRRAFVGGNPVQRVQGGTSSPCSPLSWEPAYCLVWSWHSLMNCRRISNQLLPTPIHAQTGALGHLPLRDPFRLAAAAAKSLQSCLTLCDPIDGSPPGSPAPGILQARTLEWAAISFSSA